MDAYSNTRVAMTNLGYDFNTYYGKNFFANDAYIEDISNFMLSMTISIAEKLGKIETYNSLKRMPILRRNNKKMQICQVPLIFLLNRPVS